MSNFIVGTCIIKSANLRDTFFLSIHLFILNRSPQCVKKGRGKSDNQNSTGSKTKPQRKMHNVLLSGGKIVTGPGSIEHPMDDDATFLLWSKTNQTAGWEASSAIQVICIRAFLNQGWLGNRPWGRKKIRSLQHSARAPLWWQATALSNPPPRTSAFAIKGQWMKKRRNVTCDPPPVGRLQPEDKPWSSSMAPCSGAPPSTPPVGNLKSPKPAAHHCRQWSTFENVGEIRIA